MFCISEENRSVTEVKNLDITFRMPTGDIHAIRGVNFSLRKNEVLALVGESGCGKIIFAKTIVVYSRSGAKLSEEYACGNGTVWYCVKDSLKLADNYALKYDTKYIYIDNEEEELEPIYDPEIVYGITNLHIATVGTAIGIVVLSGIVYYVIPASTVISGATSGSFILRQAVLYA